MTSGSELGAAYLGEGKCRFRVWAPSASHIEVRLLSPKERLIAMAKDDRGYHHATTEGVEPGTLYLYRVDGTKERPDPASRFQPQGVHGPSAVVDPSFAWEDDGWFGLPLQTLVIYELHVGAFSAEGTFDGVIPQLDRLQELGITAVEIMPVAQFPGERNWGYDGVYPFAVQSSYGGPSGLKRLVNACHRRGLAIVLDVVYNHLGPEGNYLAEYAPYFTERYKTPWGPALNFDGSDSDQVRRFFIENALHWITEFHFDALRLDAVHAILDYSPFPFLQELAAEVRERARDLNRQIYLFPESAANDSRLIRAPALGGYGFDAQWNDDFHHSLRGVLTGEKTGYYEDYGEFRQLVKSFREGFVYSGEYSKFRRRRHGTSTRDIPAERFVVFSQNHDQVGNRMLGERLTRLVSLEALKLAAGAVLLSPFIPLLFMGEEYGETAPFPYFVSHSDPSLIEAVRRGRREEFASFQWDGELPDPQSESTFQSAKLNFSLCAEGEHQILHEFYRELLRLRRKSAPLARLSKETLEITASEPEKLLVVRRWCGDGEAVTVFNFGGAPASKTLPMPAGRWLKLLDSSEERWLGAGSPIPGDFDCRGEVALPIGPMAFVVLGRTGNSS